MSRSDLLLRPATFQEYSAAGILHIADGHTAVTVQPTWPIPGEVHIGYSQIVRLVEAVRDQHWRQLLSAIGDPRLDSVVRHLTIDFMRPLAVSSTYIFSASVSRIGRTSYTLRVTCRVSAGNTAFCADLDLVLLEPDGRTPARIGSNLRRALEGLSHGESAAH